MPQKYTNFLKVRITDLEKKTFLLLSETAGISVSELIRKRINNIKIVAKFDMNMLNECFFLDRTKCYYQSCNYVQKGRQIQRHKNRFFV